MNDVFFVVYHYISFIIIIIHNVNQAAVLSEGNAREGKKLDMLTLKCQYSKHLANDGQELSIFSSSRKKNNPLVSGVRFHCLFLALISTLVNLYYLLSVNRLFSFFIPGLLFPVSIIYSLLHVTS